MSGGLAGFGSVFTMLVLVGSVGFWGGCSSKSHSSRPQADADEGAVRAKLSACQGYGLDGTVSETLAAPDSFLGMVRSCVAATDDCNEVIRCTGVEPKACVPPGTCEGSAFRACDKFSNGVTYEWVVDCTAMTGGLCSLDSKSGRLTCSSTDVACNAGQGGRCDGNTAVSCESGFELRQNCSSVGLTCLPLQNTDQAICATEARCAASHCDGDFAVSCLGGAERERLDCGTRVPQGTCEVVDGAPTCVASEPSPDCPVGVRYISWCEGDVGVACVQGARVATDCTAFRNAHCVEDAAQGTGRCEL